MKYYLLAAGLCCLMATNFDATAQQAPAKVKTEKVKKVKKGKAVKANTVSTSKPAPASEQPAPAKPATIEAAPVKTAETAPTKPAPVAAAPTDKQVDALVTNTKPVVETKPNGEVNWTNQYITARGESVIDTERFKNAAQAKAMARRGAIVEAQRNLLEIIKGVNVVGETKVRDMIAESDYIYTRVDGVIKGAEVVGEPVEKDGMMTVTMRVPMYQPNGLAPVFYDGRTNTATARYAGNSGTAETPAQLPSGAANPAAADMPQLAFNLNGQKFDPSLFPVLVDENSNLLFDLSKLYDPTQGKFPQLIQTTQKAFEQAGFKKGVEVIDIVKTAPGKLVVGDEAKKKINSWTKAGKTLLDIGKVLLMLI